jgi:hypothetical protein
LHNLYGEPTQQEAVAGLKKELYRLKAEVKDDDQYADREPPDGVDGPLIRGAGKKAAGKK